jgi:hypothetical protein
MLKRTILAVTTLLLTTTAAQAQVAAPRRSFGLGTTLAGVGIGAYKVAGSPGGSIDGVGLGLLLPTLDGQVFFGDEYSVDLSIPLTNMIISSVDSSGFVFQLDAMFNVNAGRGGVRLIAGPGLGFTVAEQSGVTAGGIRVPGQLGVEFLSAGRGLGFKVAVRPWVELAFASSGSVSASGVGGGALLVLGLAGYGTR